MSRLVFAAIAATGLLVSGCGGSRSSQVEGSWVCTIPNLPVEGGAMGAATLRTSYLSNGQLSGVADISAQGQGMMMSFNVTYQGAWKVSGENLEETPTSVVANYGMVNGQPLPPAALQEMSRQMQAQGVGMGESSRIVSLAPKAMTLQSLDGTISCTR